MAEHIWSVLCGRGVLDKYTGAVSMFDVREEVTVSFPPGAQHPPTVVIPLAIVSLWFRSDREVEESGIARHWLNKPGEEPKKAGDLAVDLKTGRRARTFLNVDALTLTEEGAYLFTVEYRGDGDPDGQWREVARLPLFVNLEITEPEGGEGGEEEDDATEGDEGDD